MNFVTQKRSDVVPDQQEQSSRMWRTVLGNLGNLEEGSCLTFSKVEFETEFPQVGSLTMSAFSTQVHRGLLKARDAVRSNDELSPWWKLNIVVQCLQKAEIAIWTEAVPEIQSREESPTRPV